MEETRKSSSKGLRVVQSPIDVYAAQCGKCQKWRVLASLEEYEDIRSRLDDDPFFCEKKPDVSCNDPADIIYDASRTWVIDKPNIPKPPEGFKRLVVMRKDHSKMDAYYIPFTGKKLRTKNDVAAFLKSNPDYSYVSLADFSFTVPKVMQDTIPQDVQEKGSQSRDAKRMKKE